MLHFLALWKRDDSAAASPLPTTKEGRPVDKATIGRPTLLSLPRRFEIYAPGEYKPDPLTRSISHRSGNTPSPSSAQSHPSTSTLGKDKRTYPIIRSYSLPTPVSSSPTRSQLPHFSAPPAARACSSSASPLHLDTRRPLSPIQEQAGVSPVSIKPTSPIKPISPKDSEISTLDLYRPVARPPPIPQRTTSKRESTATAVDPVIPAPQAPPCLPPLNFAPPFPGPHPSHDGDGPPRRPPRARTLPVFSIIESEAGARSSTGSLHAESFVTASDSLHLQETPPLDVLPPEFTENVTWSATTSNAPSVHLERNGTACSGASSSLRLKRRHWEFATPAFCAFWLGFLFPPFWWIGGWYFTFFSERPASRTSWQHYVLDTQWWATLTCRRRNKHTAAQRERPLRHVLIHGKPPLLPQWVGKNNTAPSLNGISYYYPFVSRERGHKDLAPSGFRRLHRLFDEITRSRLAQVKLNHETPRRMIDPWIERCRRALCYFGLLCFLVVLGVMGWSFAVGSGKAHY
ncbi:hypothetical protein R3P38DRAFT_2536235 [Favolaschia claudopus]|uniref:Uncharacterized protein n=1 Tax=Favolaschia claudopus TaxID=2862362 RepID=A0AAW0B1H6_9AGAR